MELKKHLIRSVKFFLTMIGYHIFEDGTGDALSALLNFLLLSLAEHDGDGFAKYTLDLRAKATGVSEIKLSKEVVEVVLGGSRIDDQLNIMYTAIDDDAAEELATYEAGWSSLKLHGITSLSDEASESPAKSSCRLELNGLAELGVATARLLSKQPLIDLVCLTELSDEAAEVLISNERKQQHVEFSLSQRSGKNFPILLRLSLSSNTVEIALS